MARTLTKLIKGRTYYTTRIGNVNHVMDYAEMVEATALAQKRGRALPVDAVIFNGDVFVPVADDNACSKHGYDDCPACHEQIDEVL